MSKFFREQRVSFRLVRNLLDIMLVKLALIPDTMPQAAPAGMTVALHLQNLLRLFNSGTTSVKKTMIKNCPIAFFVLALVIGVTGCSSLLAQTPTANRNEPAPIQFNGTTRLTGQASNRQGTNQFLPPSFLRYELNSVLTVYGIPLTGTAFLSTEQGSARQQLNYFSVGLNRDDLQAQIQRRLTEKLDTLTRLKDALDAQGFDGVRDSLFRNADTTMLKTLREFGGDSEQLKATASQVAELRNLKESDLQARWGELQELGITTASQSFASIFQTFGIGTNFPTYSPLTLAGVPVTGLDVEITPGNFYTALTIGGIRNAQQGFGFNPLNPATFNTGLITAGFNRQLASARIGVGKKDDTHFILTGLYARDDAASRQSDTLSRTITPRENYVVGAASRINMFGNRIGIEGEAALSLNTGDTDAPQIQSTIPEWAKNIFNPRVSSSIDYAFSAKAIGDITEIGTKISATIRRIGAGYNSLGVPFLRTDYQRYELAVDQRLLQRQIEVNAYIRRDDDNLSNTKSSRTGMTAVGASLSLNFRNLPYFKLSYAPLSQQNQSLVDSLRIENNVVNISALAGYTFRLQNGITSSTNASVLVQQGRTQSGFGNYTSRNYLLSEYVGFDIPLSLSATLGAFQTELEGVAADVFSADMSASYLFLQNLQTTLGANFSGGSVQRTTGFLTVSFPIPQIANISITAEYTNFVDRLTNTNSFNEVVGRLNISKSW
jgi:hypothetical protein